MWGSQSCSRRSRPMVTILRGDRHSRNNGAGGAPAELNLQVRCLVSRLLPLRSRVLEAHVVPWAGWFDGGISLPFPATAESDETTPRGVFEPTEKRREPQ